MRSIHPVFHVSQLEPEVPNIIPNRTQGPPPPIQVEGSDEYEIREILDSKLDRRRKRCPLLYLVAWAGYEDTDDSTSWLLADEINADEYIANFHIRFPHKPGPLAKELDRLGLSS